MSQENKVCKKINIITDVHIEVNPPKTYISWYKYSNKEDYYKALAEEYEYWVRDFNDFIRDHRSQDPISLQVERTREDVCSNCLQTWEEAEDENGTFCANCGASIGE